MGLCALFLVCGFAFEFSFDLGCWKLCVVCGLLICGCSMPLYVDVVLLATILEVLFKLWIFQIGICCLLEACGF